LLHYCSGYPHGCPASEVANFWDADVVRVPLALLQKASGTTKTRKRMNELPNEKKNFFGIR
jgi:hypothetical protein